MACQQKFLHQSFNFTPTVKGIIPQKTLESSYTSSCTGVRIFQAAEAAQTARVTIYG